MIDPTIRLRRAILHQDLALTRRILTGTPHLLRNHDVSNKSNTSLHLAAETGNLALVRLLWESGHEESEISLNVDGDTPLICAARAGHDEVVEYLAEQYPMGCVNWVNKKGMTALMEACKGGFDRVVVALLEGGAELEVGDSVGSTALHYATAYGHLKVIRTLIETGIETDKPNIHGWYPSQYSFSSAAESYFSTVATAHNEATHTAKHKRQNQREYQRDRGWSGTSVNSMASYNNLGGGGGASQSLHGGSPGFSHGSPGLSRSRAATPVFGRSERAGGRQRASSGS